MKKTWIILVNVILIAGILVAVGLYTHSEREQDRDAQILSFQSMIEGMEQVTVNYLEGEQHICDVWANYIGKSRMTMEEAVKFCRDSHVSADVSAHVIYTDDGSLEGLSSRPKSTDASDYQVSYQSIGLFLKDLETGEGIHVTRTYTNPMNGVQSLAFYNRIQLEENGRQREGLLLRVVPISELEGKWVFPREAYADTEVSLIDEEGNYIIKGRSFKNSGFFDFYLSYNETDSGTLKDLAGQLGTTGTITMKNSKGEDCLVAHTPIASTDGWTLLGYIPMDKMVFGRIDWRLLLFVSMGLLALFVFDLILIVYFNHRLQAAAREAEAANRAKTDFLSTMSHDIRTPMNAIIGLTTIAEKNVEDPDSVSEHLHKIRLASNHLLTLINDILDISKVESGNLSLSPVTFSMVETAENLVNLSQPMVKEKNIDFSFRIDHMEQEYFYADQLRLNQIFINLLSNAVKYTEPGGKVAVDMWEETLEKPDAVRLVYRVKDTGIGMSEEYMEKMYQPFSRQVDSRVNSIQGTGLGLAITKQMVERMGGTIACESALGVGTTFTVTLELALAERQPEEMKLNDLEVLLVDDDEVLLETARDALLSLGAAADVAGSAGQAVEMTQKRLREQKKYDVIIIDWKMPEVDGVETVRRIRRVSGEEVPILLISAYDWSEIEEQAKEAGVNGFISKPLFRSKLYEKINEALGNQVKAPGQEEDTADLEGMRILIAEDNDINWQIIEMMLAMHRIEAERAENGKIAVDMLQRSKAAPYDLIFMDLQMPVMNGLDATRAIRGLEDPELAGIPIIAMTADAFSENVAECMKAGMNGHIAKPIDMKLVIREIRRINTERRRKG